MKIFEAAYPLNHKPTEEELLSAAARACGVPARKIKDIENDSCKEYSKTSLTNQIVCSGTV